MNILPLEDITVLDLSWVIAGPHATKLMSDMGATVIKVESKKNLDVLRTGNQRKGNKDPRIEGGWAFNNFNTGKLGMAINLKSDIGRETLYELVKKTDVVVSNFGVSAFHKLGLDYQSLTKIREDVIVLNASGFGDYGPYAEFISFAPVVQAMTGIVSCVGYQGEKEPFDKYPPMADYLASLSICNYILAAVEYRRKTGKGQFLDLSQVESAASYLGPAILDYQINGMERGLIGNHHYSDSYAPHIAVTTEEEWENFRALVDPSGSWTKSEEFSSMQMRVKNQERLDKAVQEWTICRTAEEIRRELQAVGVSAAEIQTPKQLVEQDLHLRSRRAFVTVKFREKNKTPECFVVPAMPLKYTGVEVSDTQEMAHSVGEDTRRILKEFLNKTEAWIDNAYEQGAFE